MTMPTHSIRPDWLGLVIACLAVGLLAAVCLAYPTPSAVPQRWALQFEPGDLRLYADTSDGRLYWYFTYKIINRTGQDQLFAPEFTLFTGEGQILVSGRNVPAHVEEDLLALLGNDLLESQNQMIGEIRQGAGHAREGLVVWPADNLEVSGLIMFVAGLSGDTAVVRVPGTDREVTLRKTLQRDYLVPGNALARRRLPAELLAERWIFR